MSIKAGDLVMVVRPSPCCGNSAEVGRIFMARRISSGPGYCKHCGDVRIVSYAAPRLTGGAIEFSRLKKIDPLAEGDSLSTRKDLEVVA